MRGQKTNLIIILFLVFSCEDNASVDSARGLADREPIRGLSVFDAQSVDMSVIQDMEIVQPRVVDSTPPVPDAVVDAALPVVCDYVGQRESCTVEGLLGPCAEGERVCNITSWSQCTPINFVRTEICDGLDNDCDGVLNEALHDLDEGHLDPQNNILSRSCYEGAGATQKFGPCRPGISFCQALTRETDAGIEEYYAYGPCTDQVLPTEEECDSLDNDCDGTIDEGVLNICSECGPDPVEVCDGETDEDCDGLVDENLLNACDECGDPPRELCDFVDNDCDGVIDEDFPDGACDCSHPDYVPQPEECNGVDEDCDGFIDEGLDGGPLTKLCSTDIIAGEIRLHDRREDGPQYVAGECRLGISFCELGVNAAGERRKGYYECLQEILPQVERCNNADDDCDGEIDEAFQQGSVAVMMVVDVSGSMDEDELGAAFGAVRDSVQRLFNAGIFDVCYMLAVVGNDDMPDPYLFYPGDTCVPGVEDPPVVPIEDMSNAVNTLMLNLQANIINQGGGTENTLDAIGRFFTDDRIDWDNDGVNENILWNTNRPQARINGVENAWDVDLSDYTHRIAIIIGDEEAQGAEWGIHDAARAMAHANAMVFIIGNARNRISYQPLIDFGATHSDSLGAFGAGNEQAIADVVTEAIEEAACINNRQQDQEDQEEVEEQAMFFNGDFSAYKFVNLMSYEEAPLPLCY